MVCRNGGYDDSALIGIYCGTDSPGTFTTHGNQLYMKLSTDPFVNDRGFLMEYDGSLTGKKVCYFGVVRKVCYLGVVRKTNDFVGLQTIAFLQHQSCFGLLYCFMACTPYEFEW